MKNRNIYILLTLHLTFWIFDCTNDYFVKEGKDPILPIISWNSFALIPFYFNYFVLVPRFLKTFTIQGVLTWAISFLAFYFFWRIFQTYFFVEVVNKKQMPWEDQKVYLKAIHTSLFYGSLSTGSRLLWEWLTNLDFNKKLQLQKTENQLQLLKSNIKIPFVIDVLHELQTKARSNPAGVQDEIIKLSNIMRYNLFHVGQKEVEISHEIKILNQLLELINIVYSHKITFQNQSSETVNSGILTKVVFEYYWLIKASFTFEINGDKLALPFVTHNFEFESQKIGTQLIFKLK